MNRISNRKDDPDLIIFHLVDLIDACPYQAVVPPWFPEASFDRWMDTYPEQETNTMILNIMRAHDKNMDEIEKHGTEKKVYPKWSHSGKEIAGNPCCKRISGDQLFTRTR